jgi:hypothetical protein
MLAQIPETHLYGEAHSHRAISATKPTNTVQSAKLLLRLMISNLLYEVACPDVNRVLQLMIQSNISRLLKQRPYPDGLRV